MKKPVSTPVEAVYNPKYVPDHAEYALQFPHFVRVETSEGTTKFMHSDGLSCVLYTIPAGRTPDGEQYVPIKKSRKSLWDTSGREYPEIGRMLDSKRGGVIWFTQGGLYDLITGIPGDEKIHLRPVHNHKVWGWSSYDPITFSVSFADALRQERDPEVNDGEPVWALPDARTIYLNQKLITWFPYIPEMMQLEMGINPWVKESPVLFRAKDGDITWESAVMPLRNKIGVGAES